MQILPRVRAWFAFAVRLSNLTRKQNAGMPVSSRTMKTPKLLLLLGTSWLTASVASAAAEVQAAARAKVEFFEPLKFTDVRDSYMGDADRAGYLPRLREHLVERARSYVPEGHTLSVTITDIDMAGDFEPWRGPNWSDVRVVKDIYPPRIDLVFRLTDADGRVVKEGRRELRDLAFLMKITMAFRDDPLRHEKALLDDWLGSELPRLRKG
jgi:hypothetical protein